jgi:hypothetical protein
MRRVKTMIRVVALLSIALLSYSADAKQPKQIALTAVDRYSAGSGIERAEIAAYDPATRRIFSINRARLMRPTTESPSLRCG